MQHRVSSTPASPGCQTELTCAGIARMEEELARHGAATYQLRDAVKATKFTEEEQQSDTTKCPCALNSRHFWPSWGKFQLSANEVEDTRQMANVRIYVEEVIFALGGIANQFWLMQLGRLVSSYLFSDD
ncbi:uncharacterized protein LOC135365844 [Ornithodoros turicata]|uniref:uncharacterized protein LOC135365844 n=1 Tax=Ornithodoros turicata TaxID=34597 RepID=UPI003139D20E